MFSVQLINISFMYYGLLCQARQKTFNFTMLLNILSARVAQSVYCLTTNWTTGVRSPTEAEDFFFSSLCVQTGSGAHPASCVMGTVGPFPGGKVQPGHDADHSPPSSVEVKNE
jgi:hypothetical protein